MKVQTNLKAGRRGADDPARGMCAAAVDGTTGPATPRTIAAEPPDGVPRGAGATGARAAFRFDAGIRFAGAAPVLLLFNPGSRRGSGGPRRCPWDSFLPHDRTQRRAP